MAARRTIPARSVTARRVGVPSEVFIDTSGFFALLSAADPAHGRARAQMARLAKARRRTVTTEHVLDETYTLLKARGLVQRCPVLKTTVDTSGSLRVAWTEPAAFAAATDLFLSRLDQGFSLTDCVSFELMGRLGLKEALTTDHHYQVACFAPLLLA